MACLSNEILSQMAAGHLGPDALAEAESHLATCADCRSLLAVLVSGDESDRDGEETAAPRALGRYQIRDVLGAGGMGVVYRAHDPDLGRDVAVKVVQGSTAGDEEARQRLLREARALAKLRHDNVVHVYDVGTVDDDVFIAMELVEGEDLSDWLCEERSRAEILRVFAQAGRGLAAAHRGGLVHRDFKPSNVVIGGDGRAVVLDFGLVRPVEEPPGASDEPPRPASDLTLTRTGSTLGTPAYMAPEQYDGAVVDGRTDQFSFCVALYEALCGERPYRGSTPDEIYRAMTAGPPAAEVRLSRRLRRLLRRGLQANPADRYPDMNPVITLIEPTRRRRWPLAAAGAAALATVVVGAGYVDHQRSLCTNALDSLAGAWDDASRTALTDAFSELTVPYAGQTSQAVQRALDAYAADWATMHERACRATRITREQSSAVLDLRMDCLSRRRAELGALVRRLTNVDVPTAAKALQAVTELTPVSTCARTDLLRAVAPPPPDADTTAALNGIQNELPDAQAAIHLGQVDAALQMTKSLDDTSTAIGYAGMRARTAYWRGRALTLASNFDDAEAALTASVWNGLESGDDRQVALSAADLAGVVGGELARIEAGQQWIDMAGAMLSRINGDEELEVLLEERRAALLAAQGKYEDAEHLAKEVAQQYSAHYGQQSVQYARALEQLGFYAERQYHYDDGAEYYGKALAIHVAQYGRRHPFTARSHTNLGTTAAASGQFDEAVKHYELALEIQRQILGDDHVDVGKTLHNMGYPLIVKGDYQRAEKVYREALDIFTSALGEEHPRLAGTYYQMGYLYYQMKRYDEATQAYQRARQIRAAKFGPRHAMIGDIVLELGNVARTQKRWKDALGHYRESLSIRREALGEDHLKTLYTLTDLASAELELGQTRSAIEHLERARTGLQAHDDAWPPMRYFTDFLLARALRTTGDTERATRLARAALKGYRATDGSEEEVAEIEKWLQR